MCHLISNFIIFYSNFPIVLVEFRFNLILSQSIDSLPDQCIYSRGEVVGSGRIFVEIDDSLKDV